MSDDTGTPVPESTETVEAVPAESPAASEPEVMPPAPDAPASSEPPITDWERVQSHPETIVNAKGETVATGNTLYFNASGQQLNHP